ncbi:GNAT family N-acetyltransferase [Gordonia soli]|uniref:N-acetyltransferase domain-containing protein n=1 Tax=Gordonia soli NBRC 108243 TaxID=1223545 RepID=M0QDP6_9ACTN|nr:GNAT family N-acetyltransferase [Gordonia soli]GAC66723.1 hypothetical protein GS4_03_01710 [Gordonia soli NBRC 108243]
MTPPTVWPDVVPVLTDGTVTLRAHRTEDIPGIVEMARDPESLRWTSMPTPYGPGDAEGFVRTVVQRGWDEGTAQGWAIEHEGEFAGNLDLRGSPPASEIGYILHPAHRGRGVMGRAVDVALDHAFGAGGFSVITWRAPEGNVASLRVAHSRGFRLTAAVADGIELRDGLSDAWYGSIHAGDLRRPRTTWHSSDIDLERLRLRPVQESDDQRIRETLDDPRSSRRSAPLRSSPSGIGDAARDRHHRWWTAARGETWSWVVADRDSDVYLADIALVGIDDVTGTEIAFGVHPDAHGRRILPEVIPEVVRAAVDSLGVRRLTMFAAESDHDGIEAAESAGFRICGVQRRAAPVSHGFEDLIGYDLLRSDIRQEPVNGGGSGV